MEKMKLDLYMSAKLVWLNPPENIEEQARREQANIIAGVAADKLNTAVKLIILEMINRYD